MTTLSDLPIETVSVSRLFCSPINPRRNDAAAPNVAASARRFGRRDPTDGRPSGEAIAGRLKAAVSRGMEAPRLSWFADSAQDANPFAIAHDRTYQSGESVGWTSPGDTEVSQ